MRSVQITTRLPACAEKADQRPNMDRRRLVQFRPQPGEPFDCEVSRRSKAPLPPGLPQTPQQQIRPLVGTGKKPSATRTHLAGIVFGSAAGDRQRVFAGLRSARYVPSLWKLLPKR